MFTNFELQVILVNLERAYHDLGTSNSKSESVLPEIISKVKSAISPTNQDYTILKPGLYHLLAKVTDANKNLTGEITGGYILDRTQAYLEAIKDMEEYTLNAYKQRYPHSKAIQSVIINVTYLPT